MESGSPPSPRRPRFTAGQLGLAAATFVVGGVLAIIVDRALSDSGPMRAQETVIESPTGTLEELPTGPVDVVSERVRLPQGFVSRRIHGGPTFTFVEAGQVEVEADGQTETYPPGGFFFFPAGQLHTIRVLDTAFLAVVRLLPEGAEGTTEIGGG